MSMSHLQSTTHTWSDEARERLLNGSQNTVRRVRNVWSDFLDFIASDNVLQVAVGLIIASAFTAVVKSLVSDVLLPPISLLPFMAHRNLREKFAILKRGPHGASGYNTLQQAADDGAVTMAYGVFLDQSLTFIVLGLVLYAIAQLYALISHDTIIKHTVRCIFCRKYIAQKAKRCPECTSWQDGREDRETSALPPPHTD